MKKGVEQNAILSGKPMMIGGTKHRASALALFPLAALIALASVPVGPASASAKAVCAPPNFVLENWVGTARYEFVGFIGQIYRHTTTETHIATGYAGTPSVTSATSL